MMKIVKFNAFARISLLTEIIVANQQRNRFYEILFDFSKNKNKFYEFE